MGRIELRSEITRFSNKDGLGIFFPFAETNPQHFQGSFLRGRIHTEHRDRWEKEGVYVIQIYDKDNNLVDTFRSGNLLYWTKTQLTQILATAVSAAEMKCNQNPD